MIRNRSMSKPGPFGTHTHTSNAVVPAAPVTSRMEDWSQSMVDYVNQGAVLALAEGRIVNNPCDKVTSSTKRSGGGFYYAFQNANPVLYSQVTGSGSLTDFYRVRYGCPLLTVSLNDTASLEHRAMSQALAAIDKAPYAVAEDVATIRQTIEFLRSPLKTVFKLLKEFERDLFRSSRYRSARSDLAKARYFSSIWLEYRFAFSPTTRSVINVIDSLNRPNAKRYDRVQSARGYAESSKTSYDRVSPHVTFERYAELKRSCTAVAHYHIKPPLSEWSYKYGLRFKDIPELMWDLFPFSFMIDRFIDVGSGLRGLTNFLDPHVKILSGTVSWTSVSVQKISAISQSATGWTVNLIPDEDVFESTTYDRNVWHPTLVNVRPPVLPGGLVNTISNQADLAALLVQRFLRFPQST